MILLLYADCWYHVVAIWSTCCHVGLPFCSLMLLGTWFSCCSPADTFGCHFFHLLRRGCHIVAILFTCCTVGLPFVHLLSCGCHVVHLLHHFVGSFSPAATWLSWCSPSATWGCHFVYQLRYHLVYMLFTSCHVGLPFLSSATSTTWLPCCSLAATWGCHFVHFCHLLFMLFTWGC